MTILQLVPPTVRRASNQEQANVIRATLASHTSPVHRLAKHVPLIVIHVLTMAQDRCHAHNVPAATLPTLTSVERVHGIALHVPCQQQAWHAPSASLVLPCCKPTTPACVSASTYAAFIDSVYLLHSSWTYLESTWKVRLNSLLG